MNERIKELLEQSTNPPWDGELGAAGEFNLEKFAQSIVRACVTKMALEIMDEQWVDDAVKNTYEHFGVEE